MPLLEDFPAARLVYEPFSNYATYNSTIAMRQGISKCYPRQDDIETTFTCYEDTTYRRKAKCPYYFSIVDLGSTFSFGADLEQDSIQYDGAEFVLQVTTKTKTGQSDYVRFVFEIKSACIGSVINPKVVVPDQEFTLYNYGEKSVDYSFSYAEDNCEVRHRENIAISQKCYIDETRIF